MVRGDKIKPIESMAETIIAVLKKNGITIQRYDSMSSNSIYLKLDYGVCNSIRISDHAGKGHLDYKYNVIFNGTTTVESGKLYLKYFFSQHDYESMLRLILFDRNEKLKKYGKFHYGRFMEKNLRENFGKQGFWSDAKVV